MAWWNSALNWIGNAGRNVVEGAKKVGNKIGQGINWIGNGVEGVYGKVKKIPIIGNVIGHSGLGQAIETGLGIAKHAGNALEGKESFGEAIPNIISSLGGNPAELSNQVSRRASDLLANIIS